MRAMNIFTHLKVNSTGAEITAFKGRNMVPNQKQNDKPKWI